MELHDNPLKLNISSIASSTPECSNSSLNGPLVHFEEYDTKKSGLQPLRKKLTIKIDESYGFEQNSQQQQQTPVDLRNIEPHAFLKSDSPVVDMNTSHQEKVQELKKVISNITRQLAVQKQRSKYLQGLNQQLQSVKDELTRTQKELQKVRKKQETIAVLQSKNQQLTYEVARLQQLETQEHFYDEKLREKQSKIKELQKHNDKLTIINKSFQKELRESDKKIVDLQKQLQKNLYANQYENLAKIKESSLKLKESSLRAGKQNFQATNCRKSLDKKKNNNITNRISSNRGSSSATFISKKLLREKNNH